MLITITTGVRIARNYPQEGFTAKVFTVDAPDVEVNPDDIFHAANRIDDVDVDCRNLNADWLKTIRRALDTAEAPSMCGGDTIELIAANGTYLGGWNCESIGWSKIETEATR